MGPSEAISQLRFISTKSLERGLDGSDEAFAAYYFAIYHCTPDEPADINDYRNQLRTRFPEKSTPVGKYFVLGGEPAFLALSGYYLGMIEADTLSDEFRDYMRECLEQITTKHHRSQRLGIDLLEGQLAHDPRLEFFACMALENRQIIISEGT